MSSWLKSALNIIIFHEMITKCTCMGKGENSVFLEPRATNAQYNCPVYFYISIKPRHRVYNFKSEGRCVRVSTVNVSRPFQAVNSKSNIEHLQLLLHLSICHGEQGKIGVLQRNKGKIGMILREDRTISGFLSVSSS